MKELDFSKARQMLEESHNPLFFYHDDPDGLCSFLLLRKSYQKGHGHIIKASPYLSADFLPRIEEHKSDLIVVLDIAHIEEDFIAQAKLPIIWIDHHEPNEKRGTLYINPRMLDDPQNLPVSWLCHQITKQDAWLGIAGCVSDWVIPPDLTPVSELVSEPYTPAHLLFETPLGTLIKVLSFNLKGQHADVKAAVSTFLKINNPDEILTQSSAQGKFLWKKYQKMNREYEDLLGQALSQRKEDPFLLFLYHESKTSLTKDLSNEVYAKNPDKTIMLGREKAGKVMFSLRSVKNLPPALERALVGLDGRGGGHEHACGGWINQDDFPEMLSRLKDLLA